MQSFEEIREKEIKNLTYEMGEVAKELVKEGWTKEQVVAYVKQLLESRKEAES